MTSPQPTSPQLGERIGAGRTAEVYTSGTDRVLKLYQNFIPVAVVEREFVVTRTAYQAGLPVPEPYQIIQQGDRYGIVFERIYGTSLMQAIQQRPWKLRSLATQLAELHVKINAFAVPVDLLSQREQILFGLDHADGLASEQKALILQLLATLPDGNSLCHGDFHPENVLLTARGPVIIDWMTGTRGNPAADLVRSLVILETSALPPHIPLLQRSIINLFRKSLVSTYRSQYLLRSPHSQQELMAWQIPLLGARLFEVAEYPTEKTLLLKRIDRQLKELEEQ
jgi:uncharacterized protein (TIGR02172 family)